MTNKTFIYIIFECNLYFLCFKIVAKEASDIVILDDNFSSIVKSVMWLVVVVNIIVVEIFVVLFFCFRYYF